MTRKLTPAEKASLRSADRNGVVLAITRLPRHWRNRRWVGLNNRFADDLKSALESRASSTFKRLLGDYIAASGPIHCADAWSYLGRALNAEIKGDDDRSLHLAYYAELRAAMGLMAAEGVGVFLTRHYVVDDKGYAHPLGHLSSGKRPLLPTHQAMWRILEHWAGLQRSASLVGNTVSVHGVSADDWLRAFRTPTALLSVANGWFRVWGIDLRAMSLDRDARNIVSYRPRIRSRPGYTLRDSTDFLEEFWRLFEPQEDAPFVGLDRFLVRALLEHAHYRGAQPTTARRNALRVAIREAGIRAGLDPGISEAFAGFAARDSEADDPYVLTRAADQAERRLRNRGPLCRAALMARMATGAWADTLRRAGVEWEQLSFWWDEFGHERGFWRRGAAPDSMVDLWPDVSAALDELDIMGDGFGSAVETWNGARTLAPALAVLDATERISLWGLSA